MNSGRNCLGVKLGALLLWLRDLGTKRIGAEVFGELEMWCWRRMKKIKWSEKVTNERVLELIGEKRALLNNTSFLRRKDNRIGHILRNISPS